MGKAKEKNKLPQVRQSDWMALVDNQKENIFGKLPPQETDMEKFVLGGMMMNSALVPKVKAVLQPEMFFDDRHELICRTIYQIYDEGGRPDILQVTAAMRKNKVLHPIDGPLEVTGLTQTVGIPDRALDFLPLLRELWWRRQLIAQGTGITEAGYGGEALTDIARKLSNLHSRTIEIISGAQPENYSGKFDEAMFHTEQVRDGKIPPFLTTSFPALDKKLRGYSKGDMICIAARPGMGKTAFVTSSMSNYASMGVKTGMISLEMGSKDIVYRLQAIRTGIPFLRIKEGKYDDTEKARLMDELPKLAYSCFINTRTPMNTELFKGIVMEMVEKYGIELLFFDYIQLAESSKRSTDHNREQEVSHISRTIKTTAQVMDIPIIALSQLSRAVENRKGGNNMPQLSDLRESGAIEQDCDKVIFLHRPEYYNQTEDEAGNNLSGKVQLMIAKHRNGATGRVTMDYLAETMMFKDPNAEIHF